MLGRRQALQQALAAIPFVSSKPITQAPPPQPLAVTWDSQDCPRCGRIVLFLPGQRTNRCSFDDELVRNGI